LIPLPIKFPIDYDEPTYHPLGINFYKGSESKYIFSVNHAHSDSLGSSIEMYELSSDGLSAIYVKTIRDPLMYTPNSVFPISETEILFTNDHKFSHANEFWLAEVETFLALPTGSIVYLNHETGEARVLDQISYANGITTLNSTHMAVSSTLVPAVHIYSYESDWSQITLEQKLRPKFAADNLHLDSDGKLLIAGHPHSILCAIVAKENKLYDFDGNEPKLKAKGEKRRAPSWVVEWDGNGDGILKDLFISNKFGTSTAAVRDVSRNIGMIFGLYEEGVLVFKP
jgi:arylesterase / paraoxonase